MSHEKTSEVLNTSEVWFGSNYFGLALLRPSDKITRYNLINLKVPCCN